MRPGQMHQACSTDAQTTGMATQTRAQSLINGQVDFFDDCVGIQRIGETEWQGRFFHVRQHVAKERFVLFTPASHASLGHIVAIGNRLRQRAFGPQQECLGFMLHKLQCSVV
ncbi:hypothetical protein PSCICJ_04340 [Pseudomonas cichorii]|nr:hypothetical protein PSCICJ_04340 [Pseudomonas cichorii]